MPKVLIVEDDFLVADMVCAAVAGAGYEVCGVANSERDALALGELYTPDLAVIDVQLGPGGDGIALAMRLAQERRIGILYATGNCHLVFERRPVGEACLSKPFPPDDVVRALRIVEQIVSTGAAAPPFPHGLRLIPRD